MLWNGGGFGKMAGTALSWLGIGSNANGTNNWRGGWTELNERGAEIVNLPRGTQIIPHQLSKRMADQSGSASMVIRLELSDDIDARIMSGAQQAAEVRIERFAQNELPGRVSSIQQYELERM